MGLFETFKNAIIEAWKYAISVLGIARTRTPDQVIPKDTEIRVKFSTNTPKDTEGYAEITPPDGYIFKIRYFTLTTPTEVQGNILATGLDGVEKRLLKENQAESLTDQTYGAGDWDNDALFLTKIRLYGIVTGYDPATDTTNPVTTADREVILKMSGTLLKYKV